MVKIANKIFKEYSWRLQKNNIKTLNAFRTNKEY